MNLGLSIHVSHGGLITTQWRTYEEHLLYAEWDGFASAFISDDAPAPLATGKNQQWARSDGRTLCRCGRLYSEHVGLHLLCNGDLVKL